MSSFWIASGVRWVALAALTTLLGSLTLEAAVLAGAPGELAAPRRRLRNWSLLGAVTLLVAAIAEFGVRLHTMTGGSLSAAIPAIPAMLTRTHYGGVWITRVLMALGTVALGRRASTGARMAALAAAAGVALTTSLTGHAADRGDLSLTTAADWAHIVAAGAWAGGLFGLTGLILCEPRGRASPYLMATVKRFSRLAGGCVPIVVVTGVWNSWIEVGTIAALWTTPYGRLLLVKLAAVAALLGLGAANRYWLLPRLHGETGAGGAAARISANIRREAILALVVLACTAILGESTPARHARDHHRAALGGRPTGGGAATP